MKSKPKPNVFTFTINRSKWRSGGSGVNQGGNGITLLENPENGYRCCLGFACLAAGFKRGQILDEGEPGNIKFTSLNAKKELLIGPSGNSEFSYRAIEINDNQELTREAREDKLIKLGKHYNIQIKFKGEYV